MRVRDTNNLSHQRMIISEHNVWRGTEKDNPHFCVSPHRSRATRSFQNPGSQTQPEVTSMPPKSSAVSRLTTTASCQQVRSLGTTVRLTGTGSSSIAVPIQIYLPSTPDESLFQRLQLQTYLCMHLPATPSTQASRQDGQQVPQTVCIM